MRIVATLLALLLLAVPATALEPGPDDGLSPAEYERRMVAWCTGLTTNYGWSWVPGWEDDPFSPVCTRPDDRGLSWGECLAAGWEWDCPPPSRSAPAPKPAPTPEPEPESSPEPEPTPEPESTAANPPAEQAEEEFDPPVNVIDTWLYPCSEPICMT